MTDYRSTGLPENVMAYSCVLSAICATHGPQVSSYNTIAIVSWRVLTNWQGESYTRPHHCFVQEGFEYVKRMKPPSSSILHKIVLDSCNQTSDSRTFDQCLLHFIDSGMKQDGRIYSAILANEVRFVLGVSWRSS